MKIKLFTIACRLFLLILTTGCATIYTPIHPRALNYKGEVNTNGVAFAYKYDVLRNGGNKKYVKKEDKKGIRLVAIKITNNTGKAINVRDNIKFYGSGELVYPIEPEIVHSQLKQIAPLYLLYGLLWLNISNCENNECDVTPLPIGIPIGLGNMITAASANKKFKEELIQYNILDRTIEHGETAYGLVGFRDAEIYHLSIKVENILSRQNEE